jgi:hypothetical protein
MSSCLAPQFKWPPSTRATVFREPGGGGGGGCVGTGSFRPGRVHCAMSSAAVLEAERLESLAAGGRRLVYDPSNNTNLPVMSTYLYGANAATHALNYIICIPLGKLISSWLHVLKYVCLSCIGIIATREISARRFSTKRRW